MSSCVFYSMKLHTLNGQSKRPSGATSQQNIDTCINSMTSTLFILNMKSIKVIDISLPPDTLFYAKIVIFSPKTWFTPPVTLTLVVRFFSNIFTMRWLYACNVSMDSKFLAFFKTQIFSEKQSWVKLNSEITGIFQRVPVTLTFTLWEKKGHGHWWGYVVSLYPEFHENRI